MSAQGDDELTFTGPRAAWLALADAWYDGGEGITAADLREAERLIADIDDAMRATSDAARQGLGSAKPVGNEGRRVLPEDPDGLYSSTVPEWD